MPLSSTLALLSNNLADRYDDDALADLLTNYTLSPFKLLPLADASPMAALSRLEALSQALCLALRAPTSERTGPVDVPVGALVELGVRLVGMSIDMPVSERNSQK